MTARRDPVPPWERPASPAPDPGPVPGREAYGRSSRLSGPEGRRAGRTPSPTERRAVRTIQWIAAAVSAAVALLAMARQLIASRSPGSDQLLDTLPTLWPLAPDALDRVRDRRPELHAGGR